MALNAHCSASNVLSWRCSCFDEYLCEGIFRQTLPTEICKLLYQEANILQNQRINYQSVSVVSSNQNKIFLKGLSVSVVCFCLEDMLLGDVFRERFSFEVGHVHYFFFTIVTATLVHQMLAWFSIFWLLDVYNSKKKTQKCFRRNLWDAVLSSSKGHLVVSLRWVCGNILC